MTGSGSEVRAKYRYIGVLMLLLAGPLFLSGWTPFVFTSSLFAAGGIVLVLFGGDRDV